MTNLATLSLEETARTDPECARQRMENLCTLGNIKTILELCVGPSLKVHTELGKEFGVKVYGNDIDVRWKHYYPEGSWSYIGDAIDAVLCSGVIGLGALVFAPPVSKGCTGRRIDSLSIEDVRPNYYDFLDAVIASGFNGIAVLVLPARSTATQVDRRQYHHLMNNIYSRFGADKVQVVPLHSGKRRIRKYIDIYIDCRR